MSEKISTGGGTQQLKGKLNTWDGWSVGTGAMMGVSIFVTSGSVSGIAGPAAGLGYFLASIAALIVALCFAEVAAAFPNTSGGAYIYPRKTIGGGIGKLLGFISGWAIWGGQGLGSSVVALFTADYLNWTLKCLGSTLVLPTKLIAVLLIVAYAVINMISTQGGRIVQLSTTFVIAAMMIIYCFWGGSYVDTSLWADFMPNGIHSLWLATATGLMAYGAWSIIPAMSSEFQDPARQVPRAMISSLLTCGVVFGVFVLIMNGLTTPDVLAGSSAPASDALMKYTRYGALFIAVGGIFACVSSSNAHVMGGARVPFSMANDGYLPKALSKVNKNGTPYMAIAFLAVCQIIVSQSFVKNLLIQMIVFVTSVSWLISIICLVPLRRKHPELKPQFRTPLYPVTLIVALVILAFLMTRFSTKAITIGLCWILLGAIVFLLFAKTPLKKFCNPEVQDE